MKAVKIAAIAVATASLLIGITDTATAKTHVSIGVGIGYPGFYGGYSHHYGHHWGHHYPYRSSVFIGGWWPGYYDYYYPHYPGYYVVAPPPPTVIVQRPPVIVEQQPVVVQPPAVAPPAVVEKQPVVVQPKDVDENTQKVFKDLRYKKSELMRKLEIGDRDSRIQAIRDLGGFSFDDNIRQAIENVLLTNSDSQLRLEAAQALGSVKNTKSLPALQKARINDSELSVRQTADAAIRNIEAN
jgi:hypothetical protein